MWIVKNWFVLINAMIKLINNSFNFFQFILKTVKNEEFCNKTCSFYSFIYGFCKNSKELKTRKVNKLVYISGGNGI